MAAMAEGGAVVRQGHLRKLKTMKKKYFVLRAETSESSARLEYYESEKKFRSGAAPRRVLPLKSCYNITRRLDLKQKHVIALFTKEEQLCIVAENEVDLHAWLTAILKQFRSDDASEELLHPIQHVWQVNVQKKGLGASKNIQGLYNLCLTDKTLTLVKIKSQNNVISNLDIQERVEYSLKNIRRCGDSECFFYMEVGRQTATGAGELWMHSDDSNIAQSMHSTIYHAMRNCAKETENEKDHIVVPAKNSLLMEGSHPLPARRQTYSDGRGRAGIYNDKGLCVGSCIRQCVCVSATYSIDDSSAAIAPLTPTNDSSALRKRCETMPSRASSSYEPERLPPRDSELDGLDSSRDDIDSISEWYRTPRIPEEPDCCDIMSKDFMSMTTRGSSIAHSRTSSMGADEPDVAEATFPDGYLPMAPGHEPLGLVSSSGSVCSGTPSTDPRFSEYQLEPATAHISAERSTRAYSVGSRPAAARPEPARLRAYSAGARRPPAHHAHAAHNHAHHAHLAHHHPRASADDLMELDFSTNSPAPKMIVARTPPGAGFMEPRRCNVDEYVDMSPRNAGYVEMRPGERAGERDAPATPATPATPDGYVEMSYGRAPTRPIAIAAPRQAPRAPAASPAAASPAAASPDDRRRRREPRTPLGSQTLFHMSMESPSSPPESDVAELEDDHHYLSTVREISEDGRRSPEARPADADEVSSSPQYVQLVGPEPDEPPANPTAAKTIVRPDDVRAGVHYAALDLEPRRAPAAPAPRLYTQIDFLRSEKYAADAT
ncbi:insulin receptor substrate 1 isoform X3 [Nymphalis io]|uniref:insulin receptor substrate 1 isoform X3 n=1 Tax=Inachis io TaxID=171585 RepID=UPI00216A0F47|nr:insulin receptor substrate 1 isoform X3 [Nymphalis io]